MCVFSYSPPNSSAGLNTYINNLFGNILKCVGSNKYVDKISKTNGTTCRLADCNACLGLQNIATSLSIISANYKPLPA